MIRKTYVGAAVLILCGAAGWAWGTWLQAREDPTAVFARYGLLSDGAWLQAENADAERARRAAREYVKALSLCSEGGEVSYPCRGPTLVRAHLLLAMACSRARDSECEEASLAAATSECERTGHKACSADELRKGVHLGSAPRH